MSWNFSNALEPTLADLLLAARVIEVDDKVRLFSFEVCWWVIEREVPVFTYTDKSNIDCVLRD